MAPARQIQITVHDKGAERTEAFTCDMELVRQTMKYFEPLIRKQLANESAPAPSSNNNNNNNNSGKMPILLRVNCDVDVFAWLVDWMEGRKAPMTPESAVSIALSADFLGMREAADTALQYIHDRLVDVILSGVDMSCVPGDLLGRLSATMRDVDLVDAMYALHNKQQEDHANRGFLSALLRHWVTDRIASAVGKGGSSNNASRTSAGSRRPSSEPPAGAAAGAGVGAASSGQSGSGLRWCRLCNKLYDYTELQRIHRTQTGSQPQTALCSGTAGQRIGPRGEVYRTHVPASTPVVIAQPANAGGVSSKAVELWAWRVIGATRYVSCRRCQSLVTLSEVSTHRCSSVLKPDFVPAEQLSAGSTAASEIFRLVRWYQMLGADGVYAGEGIVYPLMCPKESAGALAAESIAVPESNTTKGNNTTTNNNNVEGKENTRKPQEQQQQQLQPCAWVSQPVSVSHVSAVTASGIPLMDIDVQNYYERDFMHRMLMQLAAVHKQKDAAAAAASTTVVLSAHPKPARRPVSPVPSPRPGASAAATSAAPGGQANGASLMNSTYPAAAGRYSLALGSSGQSSKPSLKPTRKPTTRMAKGSSPGLKAPLSVYAKR